VVIERSEIWWASLPDPVSGLGFRRPVLVIQSDAFNQSRIQTVIPQLPVKSISARRRAMSL
jgi:mRNA-degrading endonuclease toxin of MazEF toxin-antitoxin module